MVTATHNVYGLATDNENDFTVIPAQFFTLPAYLSTFVFLLYVIDDSEMNFGYHRSLLRLPVKSMDPSLPELSHTQ